MLPYASSASTAGAADVARAHLPSNLSTLPRTPPPSGAAASGAMVTSVQAQDYQPLVMVAAVTVGVVLAGFALGALQKRAARWGGWSLSQIARRSR